MTNDSSSGEALSELILRSILELTAVIRTHDSANNIPPNTSNI